jgi:hypothetical protein
MNKYVIFNLNYLFGLSYWIGSGFVWHSWRDYIIKEMREQDCECKCDYKTTSQVTDQNHNHRSEVIGLRGISKSIPIEKGSKESPLSLYGLWYVGIDIKGPEGALGGFGTLNWPPLTPLQIADPVPEVKWRGGACGAGAPPPPTKTTWKWTWIRGAKARAAR